MTYHLPNSAWRVACHAFSEALRPPTPMRPSHWARENLIVPDGPRKLDRWDPTLTPYIQEPLDLTSSDCPVNEFCVMKSAQTGFTTMLLAAVGHTIDHDRADMMIVQPTDGALSDFNSKKLQPCLEETKATARRVARQTSRSASGSTTYEKRFGRYTLTLALASSSADLRSKTVQKAFLDEIDEYPIDLDGQGSPFEMIEARQESFLREGTWKRAKISTPTIKGASAIEAEYEASDKRRWHVRCPHCEDEFVFEFGRHFHFDQEWPWRAWCSCPYCGAVLEEHDRARMVRAGRWIATAPAPGRKPGFHFDALSSPFVPWSKIAERYVAAAGDPQRLKGFYNLTLGLPFEIRGDAPDHVRLLERREDDLKRGHVPARGLLLIAAADVQMRGIWVEIVAFAPNRESWVVDAFYCDGSTEAPGSLNDAPDSGNAFSLMLQKTIGRDFPDAFGRRRKIDALGIDSGYRSHVVYATVRAAQQLQPLSGLEMVYATKGMEGWGRPALGAMSLVDIDVSGHRYKKGCKVWPVGTWPLKGAFYADLRKEGRRAGAELDPPGYCHFGAWLDEGYFRQITSEYLVEETYRGRPRKFWKLRASERDNHWLDTRVMAMALAEHLGLSTGPADYWAQLERIRGAPTGDGLELWQAAARVAAGGQAGAGEADAQVPAEERPMPPAAAPEASETAQEATEPPTALPDGEFALDVDTIARRMQERERAEKMARLAKLNAGRF